MVIAFQSPREFVEIITKRVQWLEGAFADDDRASVKEGSRLSTLPEIYLKSINSGPLKCTTVNRSIEDTMPFCFFSGAVCVAKRRHDSVFSEFWQNREMVVQHVTDE
jgi:hypothetical protein